MLKILNLFSFMLILCSICEMVVSIMTMKKIIKYELYEKTRTIILCLNICNAVTIIGYIIFCFFTALFFQILLRGIAASTLNLQLVLHELVFSVEVPKERSEYFLRSLKCSFLCIGLNALILML